MKTTTAKATILALFAAASAESSLVIYPEYPPQIERDYAYRVTVTQGGESHEIPVYNHCEKSAIPVAERTRGGDVNRRFCEFAFSGEPVRIDIAVCEDVRSYSVFTSKYILLPRFKDGVISVITGGPINFGIRLNDSDKTILSVFADAPEDQAKIPSRDDPGVLYVDGWLDPPTEEGVIVVEPPIREVYIAPGAVLNARLRVQSPGAFVHGRGMVLDPFSDIFRFNQLNNTKRIVVNVSAADVVVEDIKIVDARTYNFGSWAPRVTFRNIKALSSMMCTDGITSGGEGLRVEGAWLYVGDNGLVISGMRDATYRDIAIGTSCKAIFPQCANERVTLENIDVFRADEGVIQNTYNNSLNRNSKWNELDGGLAKKLPGPQDRVHLAQSFFIRNLCAVDCVLFPRFFVGGNMGTLPKTFVFDNLSIPYSTGESRWSSIGKTNGVAVTIYDDPAKWLITDNYTLSITNLWIGGEKASGFAPETVRNGQLVSITVNDNPLSALRVQPNRREVNWVCPWKAYVGNALLRDWRVANPQSGEQRLPPPPPDENLLEDRPATRSVWQRCPSWMAKLEATATNEKGARIYRLVHCEKGAGMLNVITEQFLQHGPGTYRLSFDAAAKADDPVPLNAVILSNEKNFTAPFTLPADGQWRHYQAELVLDFDPAVTDLVALHLNSGVPADELRFKNLSLVKCD